MVKILTNNNNNSQKFLEHYISFGNPKTNSLSKDTIADYLQIYKTITYEDSLNLDLAGSKKTLLGDGVKNSRNLLYIVGDEIGLELGEKIDDSNFEKICKFYTAFDKINNKSQTNCDVYNEDLCRGSKKDLVLNLVIRINNAPYIASVNNYYDLLEFLN